MRPAICFIFFLLLLSFSAEVKAQDQEDGLDFGIRQIVEWGSPGTRVRDIQGVGVFVEYAFDQNWTQVIAYDRLEFDLNAPCYTVNIIPSPLDNEIDSYVAAHRFGLETEYHFSPESRWDPYAGVSLEYYAYSVKNLRGVDAYGNAYDLTIKAPDSFGVGIKFGGSYRFNESLKLGMAVSYSRTFSSFKVEDAVSGTAGKIKAFAPLGVSAQVTCDF